jgi:signal transduction histidine kinase
VEISQTEIALAVLDDGPGEASKKRTGHGIAGMRERVAIFGGNLVAGNRIAGGFEVRASIPARGQGQS